MDLLTGHVMYANLFIPAQVEQLPDRTLTEALKNYRTTLASIPPPLGDFDDSPAQMRAQLEDAIICIEELLLVRGKNRTAFLPGTQTVLTA